MEGFRGRSKWRIRVLVGAALLTACAAGAGSLVRDAERDVEAGRLEQAATKLETARDKYPESVEARMALGEVLYRMSRAALDEGSESEYVDLLSRAQTEFLGALELDPASSNPHFWLGLTAAYRGDLDSALESFQNARKLAPMAPNTYTNLAEIHIYRGEVAQARRRLEKARRLGSPRAVVEMNEVLASWRQGDYVEARDLFDGVFALDPSIVRTWNEAPVSDPIESFEDFTAFCCSHVACGPYMANACQEMQLDVKQRSVSEQTAIDELRIEMERRRRLREIYDERLDLDIQVEPSE